MSLRQVILNGGRVNPNGRQAAKRFLLAGVAGIPNLLSLGAAQVDGDQGLGVGELGYTPNAAIETSLLQRLDLATSMDKIDDALRKVMVAADSLGAELNLIGSVNAGSKGKTDFGHVCRPVQVASVDDYRPVHKSH